MALDERYWAHFTLHAFLVVQSRSFGHFHPSEQGGVLPSDDQYVTSWTSIVNECYLPPEGFDGGEG